MRTSREETLGKGIPNMAQSIISKCSRTWSQERRISVLHRTLEPRISVWDCVPEHIVDTQLRDTFNYLPEQRNYLLNHAIPGSAIVRSIRRLNDDQSSTLVLNSLRFDSKGEVDVDHCAQESGLTLEFSESDSADHRTIFRASTPSSTAISEYEDGDTHSNPQYENLKLENEADRGKPDLWISYSESENFEFCLSPGQPDSDVNDEAFSLESRELFTIYEHDEDVEDNQHHDELAEANSPKARELFTIYDLSEDVEDDQQCDELAEANSPGPHLSPVHQSYLEFDSYHENDEPLEAESPEPRRLSHFRLESPVPEYDDDEKYDELFEAESPGPRQIFPVHQSHSTLYDPPQYAPQTETFCPAPLRRFLEPEEMLKFDAFNDWFVHMHMNRNTAIDTNPEKSISETFSPEPHRLFPFRHTSPVPKYGDDEKDDDPSRVESPAPRRLFPAHQSHSTVYDTPQSAPQMETFCPAPLRRFLEPEEILKLDEFEDWFVRMSESSATDAGPKSRRLFPLRHESPVREYDDDEKDEDMSEAESPAPRRIFPVHQSHSTINDPPQMETFCPASLRRFLGPEEIPKFDAFEDWSVSMSERSAIDASPEPRRLFPLRNEYAVPEYEDDEKDELFEAESPAPRRLFPVHQLRSAVYDTRQPAPQVESFCPAPLRRFLEPEEILKFDAFDGWFVRMHMSKHTAIDASPEPRPLFPLQHESPVPKYNNNQKHHESFEVERPESRRFFPEQQHHSWLNEPKLVLECDDGAFERREFIPVESLRV